MSYWKWDPSFSVGIEIIDDQHKQIIQYINDLNMAFSYKKMHLVEEVLKNLEDYTKSHFSFEEELMEEAGFPLLNEHKQAHKSFIDRIVFFKERYQNGEDISKQLKTELELWLINHIKDDDVEYKSLVKKMFIKKDKKKFSSKLWIKTLAKKYFKN